tara:strand:+ start:774 stop:1085 length:312 start_codon:yes stop_codon:yes gene_type:complete
LFLLKSLPRIPKAPYGEEINEKLFRRQYPWAITTNDVEINLPQENGWYNPVLALCLFFFIKKEVKLPSTDFRITKTTRNQSKLCSFLGSYNFEEWFNFENIRF